jgi:hypothetical protein
LGAGLLKPPWARPTVTLGTERGETMSIGLMIALTVAILPLIASFLFFRRSKGKPAKYEKTASSSWSTDGFDFKSLPDPGSLLSVTQDKSGGLSITVAPAPSDRIALNFVIAFWVAVLAGTCIWLARGVWIRNASIGWAIFLFVWTLLGPWLAQARVRALTVFEMILIDSSAITLQYGSEVKFTMRRYDIVHARNLRYLDPSEFSSGSVAFDHDGVVVTFAAGISRLEAIRLIKTIRLRFRIPDDIEDVEPLPIAAGRVAAAPWDDFA